MLILSLMEGQTRNLIRQKIIDSQSAGIPIFTKRDIRLPKVPNKATAVIGIRRSGKTTFLWQIISERVSMGTPREGLLYFSFEDERLITLKSNELQLVIEEYYRLHPEWRDQKRSVMLFDEIQNITGWEMFVRRLLDTEKLELFISGSSAKMLSREVAGSMRGRAMEVVITPFSFREYLRHIKREPVTGTMKLTKSLRSILERDFRNYLLNGGFPEAVDLSFRDRNELLRGYVDIVILRDVVERHQVTHPVALRWMVRHILSVPGGLFSVNKFYRTLRSQGIPVAKDTLHAYLAHLEDAFLLRIISINSRSERRKMVNPRKIYPVDSGLIPVFNRSGQPNWGHALETAVLLELERRKAEVTYVRTGSGFEVDFHAIYPDGRSEMIQVCSELIEPATRMREIRSLLESKTEFPNAVPILITLETEIFHELPDEIIWLPAYEWFLRLV